MAEHEPCIGADPYLLIFIAVLPRFGALAPLHLHIARKAPARAGLDQVVPQPLTTAWRRYSLSFGRAALARICVANAG
jgi:hypothetical protein